MNMLRPNNDRKNIPPPLNIHEDSRGEDVSQKTTPRLKWHGSRGAARAAALLSGDVRDCD